MAHLELGSLDITSLKSHKAVVEEIVPEAPKSPMSSLNHRDPHGKGEEAYIGGHTSWT